MTIDQFADLTRTRIPTPAEFKAFADAMGFRIVRGGDGSGVLRVKDKTDPMARALARMLGREPWRSEVIKLAEGAETPQPAAPEPAVAVAPIDPAPVAAAAGPPPDDGDRQTVREGVCVARADGWLAWASYRGGEQYRFAEYRVKYQGHHVASIEVFAGGASGFVGPAKFAEMFAECGP